VALCTAYFDGIEPGQQWEKKLATALGGSISVVVLAVNIVLRESIIILIKKVQIDTRSAELASITRAVFAAQFFNTGILLLLVNASWAVDECHWYWI
jgi:hypothetical protein